MIWWLAHITDSAVGSPQIVELSGTGNGAGASLSTTTLTFADQFVGITSSSQIVSLTNNGNLRLDISSIMASGDFAQTNNCGTSVAAGAECNISVTFTPTAVGTRTGLVTITDNALSNPQTIALSGTSSLGPIASLSPSSLSFPAQYVGTSGLPQNITLTNTGDQAISISNVQTTTSFGSANGCTTSLAPGVGCTISVFFDPSATGPRTGRLTITDNAPDSPQTVLLTGTGVDFSLSSSTPSQSAPAGQVVSFSVSVNPVSGFTGTVSLSCRNTPPLATCSVSPGSVVLSGTGAGSAVVTVTTTAPSDGAPRTPGGPPVNLGWWVLPGFLWLCVMLLFAKLRRFRRHRAFVGIVGVIMPVILWLGCGSTAAIRNPGTPPGTYQITVIASSTSGSANLQHQFNLSLTIK